MRMSYKKLWLMLVEKEISPATMRKDLNIATGTMTKLRRNEEVALSILLRICVKTAKNDLDLNYHVANFECDLLNDTNDRCNTCRLDCPVIKAFENSHSY